MVLTGISSIFCVKLFVCAVFVSEHGILDLDKSLPLLKFIHTLTIRNFVNLHTKFENISTVPPGVPICLPLDLVNNVGLFKTSLLARSTRESQYSAPVRVHS